jgi:CheY-like chemotaxis protein
MPNDPNRASKPILIVDDVISETMTLDLLCRSWGVETICALGAADAAAVLTRIRPAGIITDLLAPGADGLDCLHMIAEHAPTIPIMVVTAAAAPLLEAGAGLGHRYGLSDLVCVAKPMDIGTLRAFLAHTGRMLTPSQWDLH